MLRTRRTRMLPRLAVSNLRASRTNSAPSHAWITSQTAPTIYTDPGQKRQRIEGSFSLPSVKRCCQEVACNPSCKSLVQSCHSACKYRHDNTSKPAILWRWKNPRVLTAKAQFKLQSSVTQHACTGAKRQIKNTHIQTSKTLPIIAHHERKRRHPPKSQSRPTCNITQASHHGQSLITWQPAVTQRSTQCVLAPQR